MAVETLMGSEIPSSKKYTLVYRATHEGGGINRLPYMNRSFISFTYGGKFIEDFNLIATVTGDRINRPAYANFTDTVSTYDNLDGQHYWATHYNTNLMDFNLSTDGIDQLKLDDFLHWFRPGISRELILSEHPNRGIMARVATAPVLNLLPFEAEVEVKIVGVPYTTKTTMFKGDIQLSLVMDLPHWYSLVNVLGILAPDDLGIMRYKNQWQDPNGRTVNIFATLDALKILYEDGIPVGDMILNSMLLGNGAYANAGQDPVSCIYDEVEAVGARISGVVTGNEDPPSAYPAGTYSGYIAGAIVNVSGEGILALMAGEEGYFFYAGTAPAPTIISFTLYPSLLEDYIAIPSNTYAQYSESNKPYNVITIESLNLQQLRFTTPNIYTSYNKAIHLFKTANNSTTWETLRNSVRDLVRHARVREWAIKCIDVELRRLGNNAPLVVSSDSIYNIVDHMTQFLKNATGALYPVTFTFNSETGEATGAFTYRTVDSASSVNNWSTYGLPSNSGNLIEDVGDMLLSNYIIILDRNYPDESGSVIKWETDGRSNSHRITTDVGYGAPEIIIDAEQVAYPGICNLQILYKNMYL